MISFQKLYGLYGLEHQTVEINGDVTMRTDKRMNEQTSEYRAEYSVNGQCETEFRNYLRYFKSTKVPQLGKALFRWRAPHLGIARLGYLEKNCPIGQVQMGISLFLGGSKRLPGWFGALIYCQESIKKETGSRK